MDVADYALPHGCDPEATKMIDSKGIRPVVFGLGFPASENASADAEGAFKSIIDVFKVAKDEHLQPVVTNDKKRVMKSYCV